MYTRAILYAVRACFLISLVGLFGGSLLDWSFIFFNIPEKSFWKPTIFWIIFYGVAAFSIASLGKELKRVQELKKTPEFKK
jgi:hypothetical protein